MSAEVCSPWALPQSGPGWTSVGAHLSSTTPRNPGYALAMAGDSKKNDVFQTLVDPQAPVRSSRVPRFDEVTDVVNPLSPGSFFGDRFRIEASIGSGAMGAVFRATDLDSNDEVALKVLLRGSREEETRARFQREYDILSTLEHPGIVGIRGFGTSENGWPWLAMELIEGESLRQRIKRGPMSPQELLPILTATADALQAAHIAGVIHRDLKPDHVLLPSEGGVKLLDFGLSLALNADKLTQTGTLIGTPRYMAPEQIASAHGCDSRADIYALGIIAYEALTGDSPFVASDHGQLLGAIMTNRLEPLENRRPDLPAKLGEVLAKVMDKDPEVRFQTPREFVQAFAFAAGVSSSEMPEFSAPKIKTKRRPRWHLALALLLAALGVVAVGAWMSYSMMR